jgi:hypothetical protein
MKKRVLQTNKEYQNPISHREVGFCRLTAVLINEVQVIFFRLISCLAALIFFLLSVTTIISCAPERKAMDANVASEMFEFLQDGEISKQEIRDRLGLPSSSYENGRIVIYLWLGEKSKVYNIVLVFNEDNLLERHSVVRVR